MDMKIEWLFTRKQQIITEITDCEAQTKQILAALAAEGEAAKREVAELREAARGVEDARREEAGRWQLQVKTLEGLVVSKDDAILQLKSTNASLISSLEEKTNTNQQYYARLLELEHLLNIEKTTGERAVREHSIALQSKTEIQMQELARIRKDYEQQLAEVQAAASKAHEQELSELKRSNLQLLQRLDEEQQTLAAKSNESTRKAEQESGRLIAENTRLLAAVNDGKMRIMTLEASLGSQLQQIRILQKEMEIFRENSKRETSFLTEQRTALTEKNRKMAQRLEQLSWTSREGELRKTEQIERIRREVDKSFQEVLDRAREQSRGLEEANAQLRAALQEKTQELQKMQTISLRIKEHFEEQESELKQALQQKEGLQRQVKALQQAAPAKVNEELKGELIRKNCEAQVLQDEIKRLKAKVNMASAAQQQFARAKESLLQENQMLVKEIRFLKEKGKGKGMESRVSKSNFLSDMDSEKSRDQGELEEYKALIKLMSEEMKGITEVVKEKDNKIDKLEALIKRYERELRDLK